MKTVLTAAFGGLLTFGLAHASIIPSFVSMSDLGGGVFAYNYDVFVESPGERVQFTTTPGIGGSPAGGYDNHFTFFDFFGYVPGSASCSGSSNCANLSLSVSNTGPTAYHQAPDDNASVLNVTWTDTASGSVISSGSYLGRVTMDSTSNSQGTIEFAGQATKDGGSQDGTVTGNTLSTIGPVSGRTSAVPEPATLFLLGFGMIGLSLSRKRLAGK